MVSEETGRGRRRRRGERGRGGGKGNHVLMTVLPTVAASFTPLLLIIVIFGQEDRGLVVGAPFSLLSHVAAAPLIQFSSSFLPSSPFVLFWLFLFFSRGGGKIPVVVSDFFLLFKKNAPLISDEGAGGFDLPIFFFFSFLPSFLFT